MAASDALNPAPQIHSMRVALRSPPTQHPRTIQSLLSKDKFFSLFSFKVTSPRKAMQCDHLDPQEPFPTSHLVRPAPPNPPFLTQERSTRSTVPQAGSALRFRFARLQDPKPQNPR